jgi:hypothetical protein
MKKIVKFIANAVKAYEKSMDSYGEARIKVYKSL